MNFTDTEIQDTLDGYFEDEVKKKWSASNRPEIIWPNLDSKGKKPRFEVSFVPVEPQPLGFGGTHRRRFIYGITCVVKQDQGRKDISEMCEFVIDKFAYATYPSHPTASNKGHGQNSFWVRARPTADTAFEMDAEFRVPILIKIETLD